MTKTFTYQTSEFPSASSVNSDSLKSEIDASSIAKTLTGLSRLGTSWTLTFDVDLTAGEETTLHGNGSPIVISSVLGDHAGVVPIRTRFGTTTGMFDGEIAITQDAIWQDLGGRVTNIQSLMSLLFHHVDMSRAFGRVPFRIKTSGTGAQLRLVEVDAADVVTSLIATPHAVGDTVGAWQFQKFTTDVQPAVGDRLFRLEGRLNGATSATISHAAVTLLDVGT